MLSPEIIARLEALALSANILSDKDTEQKADFELSQQKWANSQFFKEWLAAAPSILSELKLLRGHPIREQKQFKMCPQCSGLGTDLEDSSKECADCIGIGGWYE